MASDKISVMLVSGARERLQMAAMVASVGAVSGYQVSVFLSMNALAYFVDDDSPKIAPTEGHFGELLASNNTPPFLELFQQAVELGDARIYPCSMAMDILELKKADMAEYVEESMGLTRFLDEASGGQLWSF